MPAKFAGNVPFSRLYFWNSTWPSRKSTFRPAGTWLKWIALSMTLSHITGTDDWLSALAPALLMSVMKNRSIPSRKR